MEICSLHSFDIFLQGFFLLLCIGSGFYILFKDNDKIKIFQTQKNLTELSNGLYKLFKEILKVFNKSEGSQISFKYFGAIPIVIILSFIFGIVGKGIADDWIDSKNKNHLFLKSTWSRDITEKNEDSLNIIENIGSISYRDIARKIAFKTVFDKNEKELPNENIYHQIYYQSKHEILQDSRFYGYFRKSQSMAEYSRIFSLGFLFLLGFSYANLMIMVFRILYEFRESFSIPCSLSIKDKSLKVKYNQDVFNVNNSVVIIFLVISWSIIEYLINPFFDNYKWYDYQLYVIISIVYLGIYSFIFLLFSKNFRAKKFTFFVYSIIYLISFSGYFVSSRSWIKSEVEVAKKVYGLYKFNHATKQLKEIQYAEKELCLEVELHKEKDSND